MIITKITIKKEKIKKNIHTNIIITKGVNKYMKNKLINKNNN